MTKGKHFKIVEAAGTSFDMGATLGRACSSVAKAMLREADDRFKARHITWASAVKNAKMHLPYAEEYDPSYIDFLKGYAKGSGIKFDDLFVLLCQEERGLCTDIGLTGDVTKDGSVLAAHTEDWLEIDQKNIVVAKLRPKGEPSSIIFTLGGVELVSGMNSAGICYSGNSLDMNDVRYGVPKMFVARKLSAARTIGEALAASTPPHRASSYNNNLRHSSGEMYSVEGSATDFAVIYPHDGYLVHTNHYLHPKMERYEAAFSDRAGTTLKFAPSSIVRYHRALRLVKRNLGKLDMDTLTSIMCDHVNHPASICRHPMKSENPRERTKTIFSVFYDLTRLRVRASFGNPCEGRFEEFSLK